MNASATATSTGTVSLGYFAPAFAALGDINAVAPFPTQVGKLKGNSTLVS